MRPFHRFIGNYFLDDGIITLEDLDRALVKQLAWAVQGRPLKIGEVLMEMRLITRAQLNDVLARQAQDEENG